LSGCKSHGQPVYRYSKQILKSYLSFSKLTAIFFDRKCSLLGGKKLQSANNFFVCNAKAAYFTNHHLKHVFRIQDLWEKFNPILVVFSPLKEKRWLHRTSNFLQYLHIMDVCKFLLKKKKTVAILARKCFYWPFWYCDNVFYSWQFYLHFLQPDSYKAVSHVIYCECEGI